MSTDKPVIKEESIWGKYKFDEAEKVDIASKLTIKITEKNQIEDEKKSAMSSFKAQVDSIDAIINKLSIDYQNGYEFRSIECEVDFNFERKCKTYYRKGTKEVIEVKPMTAEDFQTKLEV